MSAKHQVPKTADFMNTNVVTVTPETTLMDAARLLFEKGVSNAPVISSEQSPRKLVGFISERECLEHLSNEMFYDNPDRTVGSIMRIHPVCILPDTDIFTTGSIFSQHGYRHLPVVENGALVGLVSRRDILRALFALYDREAKQGAEKYTRPDLTKIINHRFIVG